MLAFIMLNVSVPGSVGCTTDVTRVRLLAGVGANVAYQRALLAELLVAELTIKWSLVCVHPFVHFQFVPLVASVAAATAHEPLRSIRT